VPLDLTPLSASTETLTPVTADTQTLSALAEGTETLTPEEGFHPTAAVFLPGTIPGSTTYPDDILTCGSTPCSVGLLCGSGDTELFPDDNDVTPATGLALDVLSGDTQTLTPLTED
jgi:hypothetical protein